MLSVKEGLWSEFFVTCLLEMMTNCLCGYVFILMNDGIHLFQFVFSFRIENLNYTYIYILCVIRK